MAAIATTGPHHPCCLVAAAPTFAPVVAVAATPADATVYATCKHVTCTQRGGQEGGGSREMGGRVGRGSHSAGMAVGEIVRACAHTQACMYAFMVTQRWCKGINAGDLNTG